ncbi:LuxR C-terminal-related transcriptional regulator [Serratia sp. root2]|uniref:LuxR C-terminal-related transcriptional regulator n=1 Tax=Serratia sp. root2 TaxID=3059676 RepID=UPI00288FAB04|nr:LuxR C-terminal-related transcriptional regulator [Serratia sp. root2]MDT3252435.1 LuxR C-terminal-related transcriptional regulator [Serratia sp. root2]
MKKTLTIAICETDNYFAEGVRYTLKDYFDQKGMPVNFINAYSELTPADLVFSACASTRRARYCHDFPSELAGGTLFFSIRNKPERCLSHRPTCRQEAGTLYRNDDRSAIYLMLDRALATTSKIWFGNNCPLCERSQLTRREQEVLQHMRRGCSQGETAEQMQLSVKTVNTHKQSAMKKMDLMKKHDFIHWLMRSK